MTSLFNIPAHTAFLPALARGLLDRYGATLHEALILLPSRRACLALRDTFLDVTDGAPLLLPRLQPVGEADTDELLLAGAIEAEVPEAIEPIRRQLLLSRLVRQQREAQGGITDEHAIRLAGELARLLDELQTEEIPLERLDELVPEEQAVHWQQVMLFLRILGDLWPAVLAEEGRIDPAIRRRRLLDAQGRHWRENPPPFPVIAAGITGTVPAVARLLGVIRDLPQGCIVLPGLDEGMDEESWEALEHAPAHPQYGLCRLLRSLDVAPGEVQPWPAADPGPAGVERVRFLAEIMRPAATSDAWQHAAPPPPGALAGLERVTAADLPQEALVIALRIREALETPGKRVALVTSDRNLARRTAIELQRFGIVTDDSAGTPLDQTAPGSFMLLTARAILDDLPPVVLLSALKHPLASGHDEQGNFRRRVRAFEKVALRGPRSNGGFKGLAETLEEQAAGGYWPSGEPPEALRAWLDGIEQAAAPLARLGRGENAPFAALLEAHLAFAQWLASNAEGEPDELWAREAGDAAARFFAQLAEAVRDLPPIAPSAYPALLAVLMGSQAVRRRAPGHPRVAILGQLESRLMRFDRVLIGGLNEGVWPRPPEPSPWLNRAMRRTLGLPPAELQIGIAAHDLVMAAGSGEVLLSRATKDQGGSPTTPSRWLARLDAVLKASGLEKALDADPSWLAWANALDEPGAPPAPCPPALGCPPLEARPRAFWVTDIERLIRDPYAFYAHRILALRALEPLDADPGGAERGQLVHLALERFCRTWPDELPDDAFERLLAIGREIFETLGHHPQVRAIWWPRFTGVARWFVDVERERRQRLRTIAVELRGEIMLQAERGPITLRARADRVELTEDSRFNLIDYKTGTVPQSKDVRNGISPQLTLAALIAAEGGFAGLQGEAVGELLYWGLKGGDSGATVVDPTGSQDGNSAPELAEAAREGVRQLIEWFDDPAHGYPAVPRPEIAPAYGDYDHLARIDEWRGAGDGDEQ